MRPSMFIIGLVLMLGFSSASAIEIEFDSRKPENSKHIIERLKNEPNPSFALLDSITIELSNNGYLDASVIIKGGKLVIASGPRYIFSKLILRSDATKEILLNRTFDSLNVALATEQEMQKYRDIGYHYVSAQTEKVELIDTLVTLYVSVNLGPLVEFGEQIFSGLTRTEYQLVKKYLPENKTGTLTSDYLNEAERAAAQIPFVKFNPPVALQPRPGYTVSDVVFNFLEKTPARFDGAAGFAGQENAGAVWSLALSLNNLFGQGKEVSIISERRDPRRNILNVGYTQPFFLAGLGELNLNLATRDYRDEFYEFAVSTGIHSRINKDFVTGLELGWKSVTPELGNTGYNRFTGQFSISRKTFASDFNPSGGLALKWGIDFSFRRYTSANLPSTLPSRTFNETRSKLKASIFQPFPGPILAHLALNYEGLETREPLPPLSELVLIGGPGSLRGYRNEQFAAIRAAYGTLEPRIRFNGGYLLAFYDAAYLNNRIPAGVGSVTADELFRWSYGLGFGLGNRSRNLIMSLGFNPDLGFNEPRLSIDLSSDI